MSNTAQLGPNPNEELNNPQGKLTIVFTKAKDLVKYLSKKVVTGLAIATAGGLAAIGAVLTLNFTGLAVPVVSTF